MNILKKWLFCGDSITDGNHSLCGDPNHIMGHGFAFIAAAYLGAEYPQKNIRTYNTAKSGINSARLLASWEERVLSINPDVLTLLVGINDTNTLFDEDKNSWQKQLATPAAFGENLRYMLYLARQKNPQMHLDIGAIRWLEGYIKNYKSAVVMVSHDRMFVEKTVDKVYEIEYGETRCYHGNYSSFEKQTYSQDEYLWTYRAVETVYAPDGTQYVTRFNEYGDIIE